jgi:hypothetical protein
MILILMVVALVCFVAAAFGVSSRVGLVPLGLALWVLSIILPALR